MNKVWSLVSLLPRAETAVEEYKNLLLQDKINWSENLSTTHCHKLICNLTVLEYVVLSSAVTITDQDNKEQNTIDVILYNL